MVFFVTKRQAERCLAFCKAAPSYKLITNYFSILVLLDSLCTPRHLPNYIEHSRGRNPRRWLSGCERAYCLPHALYMPTRKRTSQILVLDATQVEEADHSTTPNYASDIDDSLCPSCGEPLAWHESVCNAPDARIKEQETTSSAVETSPGLAPSPFAYALGQPVQPTPGAPARPIIWRGQVKERHPRTGLVRRVNVYQLNDGFWDCYYEADLQAA